MNGFFVTIALGLLTGILGGVALQRHLQRPADAPAVLFGAAGLSLLAVCVASAGGLLLAPDWFAAPFRPGAFLVLIGAWLLFFGLLALGRWLESSLQVAYLAPGLVAGPVFVVATLSQTLTGFAPQPLIASLPRIITDQFQPPPLSNVESFRDLLAFGESELPHAAQYSYLLFGSDAPEGQAARLAAMAAYLVEFPTLRDARRNKVPRAQINLFYVFTLRDAEWVDKCVAKDLTSTPASGASTHEPRFDCPGHGVVTLSELALYLVGAYDYARARLVIDTILRSDPSLSRQAGEGIYVVSYHSPIVATGTIDADRLLFQDLSLLPANFIGTWIIELRRQFSTDQYWDTDTTRLAILRVRSALPQLAQYVSFGQAIAKMFSGETKDDNDAAKSPAAPGKL